MCSVSSKTGGLDLSEATKVFYGNMCFVCQTTVKDTPLKKCGSCKLISYCSESHQRMHWKKHSRLCKLVKEIEALWHPLLVNDDLSWYKYRTNLLMLCELKLKHKLQHYEVNMILFPNNCEVCHKKTSLQACLSCLCVNYCSEEHRQADFVKHRILCPSFALCFQLDIKLGGSNCYPSYRIRRCNFSLMEDIESFMEENIEIEGNGLSVAMERALISELVTCPLSMLYGLTLTSFQFKENVVVHVIGSSFLETASLEAWKIILHVEPIIKNLAISFIGPDVCKTEVKNMCDMFQDKINFKFFSMFYHEYVKTPDYIQPDVICSFNCGFHEFEDSDADTWKQSLPLLTVDQTIPVIFTSFTEKEAQKDSALLLKTNKKLKMKIVKNHFASQRPYRDLESSGLFFNNEYLGVTCAYLN